MKKNKIGNKGFSLLELLISLVLFAGVISTLSFAFSKGMLSIQASGNNETAVWIAHTKLEELSNTPYALIQNVPLTGDSKFPNYSYKIDVNEAMNPKPVEVQIQWNMGADKITLSVWTMFSDT